MGSNGRLISGRIQSLNLTHNKLFTPALLRSIIPCDNAIASATAGGEVGPHAKPLSTKRRPTPQKPKDARRNVLAQKHVLCVQRAPLSLHPTLPDVAARAPTARSSTPSHCQSVPNSALTHIPHYVRLHVATSAPSPRGTFAQKRKKNANKYTSHHPLTPPAAKPAPTQPRAADPSPPPSRST